MPGKKMSRKTWNIIITLGHVASNNNLTFYLVCHKSIIYIENIVCVFEEMGQESKEKWTAVGD